MSAGLPTTTRGAIASRGSPWPRSRRSRGPAQFAWPPGTRFDYSNLGYGILGRVITNVAGAEYRDVVRDRILGPLGMSATGYLEEAVPDRRLAHGYVRRGDALVREGADPYGALASMGGLFTSVRDLATWVGGFLDAFPARRTLRARTRWRARRVGRCSRSSGWTWRGPSIARRRAADGPRVRSRTVRDGRAAGSGR